MTLSGELVLLARGEACAVGAGDSAAFLNLAVEQRVASLAYSSLLEIGGIDKNRLAALDLLTRHRSVSMGNELARISFIAKSVGVEVAVLKGQAHAERWFAKDPAVRQYSDIDLFVDPQQPEAVNRLLYALDPGNVLNGHAGALMSCGVLPDIPIRSSDVLIEIHANPLSFSLPQTEIVWLWGETEDWTTSNGLLLRRFNPTLSLIQALINSAKDNHAYLLQVVECGRALSDPNIDWNKFQAVVQRYRWDSVMDDALRFVCETLSLKYPLIELQVARLSSATIKRLSPASDRLGGPEAWRRAQRFTKLDLAVPGTRFRAVLGMARRTFSPDPLIRAFAPDLAGPYPLRAAKFWVRRQQYVQGKRSSLSGK